MAAMVARKVSSASVTEPRREKRDSRPGAIRAAGGGGCEVK